MVQRIIKSYYIYLSQKKNTFFAYIFVHYSTNVYKKLQKCPIYIDTAYEPICPSINSVGLAKENSGSSNILRMNVTITLFFRLT